MVGVVGVGVGWLGSRWWWWCRCGAVKQKMNKPALGNVYNVCGKEYVACCQVERVRVFGWWREGKWSRNNEGPRGLSEATMFTVAFMY